MAPPGLWNRYNPLVTLSLSLISPFRTTTLHKGPFIAAVSTMNLLALLLPSILLLLSLLNPASASAAAPGLSIFYNYDAFCNSPPTSGPPIHYLHICVDSSDGPVVQQLDAPGLYSVFTSPSNSSQFVIVLWNTDFNCQVQTKNYMITMYAGSQIAQPGCADWYVNDLKDGKWVEPKMRRTCYTEPRVKVP